MEGVVYKSTGSWYEVKSTENDQLYNCRIVGKLRLDDLKSTNPIAVGDMVDFQIENETEGSITKILPRKNYIVRQSPRKKHNVHLIAANVDQVFLLTTIIKPDVKAGFIDRFLMMTEPYDIPVIIIFNKWDLYNDQNKETFLFLKDIYEKIGYEVLTCSADTGLNIDVIQKLAKDKTSLISGQSGVGKSSIINALQPQYQLRVSTLSDYSGKGQHTTTFAEMLPLDFGGQLIDTPGIKTLAFNHYEVQDVAHNFKEIFEASKDCKFNNCTHRNEPKCNVKSLVEEQEIFKIRYHNYLQIIDEIENQNYWEVHKDI